MTNRLGRRTFLHSLGISAVAVPAVGTTKMLSPSPEGENFNAPSLREGDGSVSVPPKPTSAISSPYVQRLINQRDLDLMMFAPPLASGANVATSLQKLVDEAGHYRKTARIFPHPYGYIWRVNATIQIPQVKLLIDPSAKIECFEGVPLFTASDNKILIDGGGMAELAHYGGNKFLDTNQFDSIRFRGFRIDAALQDKATDDLICVSGSDTYITDLHCGNFRDRGFIVRIVKKPGHLTINNRISDIYFGGTGKGIVVTTEDGNNRPEGLSIRAVKSVLTGREILRIESVYSLIVDDAMLDQGTGYVVNFEPLGSGIRDVTITNSYLAAAQNNIGVSGGVAINAVDNGSPIAGLNITSNEIAYSAYGFSGGENVSGVLLSGNSFVAIDQSAVQGAADNWTLRDNEYNGVGKNLNLTEGANGGSMTIDNEHFDPMASLDLPTTLNRVRWNIGQTFGKTLRQSLSATAMEPTDGQYLYLSHGLIRTPDPSGIRGLSAVVSSGAYEDVRVTIVSLDSRNVVVQIRYTTVITAGAITVNVDASI